MKTSKQSNYVGFTKTKIDDYIQTVDTDLSNIFTALKGRIRFGNATTGSRGENINGECRIFASSTTANEEFSVGHTLGSIPVGYLIINQDKAGSLYAGSTAWTSSSVYLKSSVASVTYTVFLLK